jgi:hypothetical protein
MIDSLKDLEKLLKLCRKQGVIKISFDNVSLELGDAPLERVANSAMDDEDPLKGFPDGTLTPEQLMFYSSGGLPENDPSLKSEAV